MGMGINPFGSSKKEKEAKEEAKMEARLQSGTDRFNAMMANRSQNPALGQTQSGMSGFDQFQAMQAARDSVNSTYGQKIGMEALSKAMAAKGDPEGIWLKATENYRNRNSGQPAGYDKFQAMQAARGVATDSYNNSKLDGFDSRGAIGGLVNQLNSQGKLFTNTAVNQQPGYDRFQAQMGQRQMGPQFNAFGFGAQPGLAAQGGQVGSMLANMSSQGMNQLAAGQQNNPTIFKAKS